MTNKVKILNKVTAELQAMKEILYGSRMFSFNQIKDACEKAGVDKDIFTAIEAELVEMFPKQKEHDCHASPEDGCAECEKQLDELEEARMDHLLQDSREDSDSFYNVQN